MIDKLALFCYRNDYGKVFKWLMMISFLCLMFMLSNNRYYVKMTTLGFFLISLVLLAISCWLRKRAEKIPEIVLEKAKEASEIGPKSYATRAFFKLWIKQAEKGDMDNLMTFWPTIEKIIDREETLRRLEEELGKHYEDLEKIYQTQ